MSSTDSFRPSDLPLPSPIPSLKHHEPLPVAQPSSRRTLTEYIYRIGQLGISIFFPWVVRPILTGLMFAAGTALYRWILRWIFKTNHTPVRLPHINHIKPNN